MTANLRPAFEPAHTRIRGGRPVPVDPFAKAVRAGVSQTRSACEGLSKKDHWFLDDLSDAKYLSGLRRFVELAKLHCAKPTDATALFDRLTAYTVESFLTDYTVGEAYGLETFTNYEMNDAQDRHALNPSLGTVDQIAEKAAAQEVASRVLAHTVIRQRPALVQVR